MSETSRGAAPVLTPHAQIVQMMMGSLVARLIYTAARLRLADHIAAAPRTAEDLAAVTGTHAPALHRLMRTLTGLGILTHDSEHHFALTPLGDALRTGAPGAALPTILTFGGPVFTRAFDEFEHSLATGETGFEKAFGLPIFNYFAGHPEDAALFNDTMIGFHGDEPAAVVAAYDFSGFRKIVDIGGGTGNLLSMILSRTPAAQGVLFDLPHVIASATPLIKERAVDDRVAHERGDFFQAVPAGGDAYVLSHIIHDWHEDQCLTILRNCRTAMAPGGRLLLVEMVLPDGDAFHPGKLLDMVMLTVPGGQERTAPEYARLLDKAGLRLVRIVPTASAVSVVEAAAA